MKTRTTAGPWVKPWALVEIAATLDESERVHLIRAAYRSSRCGVVALALRGVTWHSVDRALDAVVDVRHDRKQGVIYLDASEMREDVITAAYQARVIIASSNAFRSELIERGICALSITDDARLLEQGPAAADTTYRKDRIA